MKTRLIMEEDSVYGIDEECMRKKFAADKGKDSRSEAEKGKNRCAGENGSGRQREVAVRRTGRE